MLATAARSGVIFAASGPGESIPGDDHINLQPSPFWKALFAECGMIEDASRSRTLVERMSAVGAPDWYKNTLLFVRDSGRPG
jgi:hypothetical protein